MNIVYLAENWPPQVGGIAGYTSQLAEHLASVGHTIHVIAPKPAAGYKPSLPETRVLFHWPILKPDWWSVWRTLIRRRQTEATNPDWILCGKALVEGRIALKYKKKFGVKFAVHTYAMEIERWLSAPKTKRQLKQVLLAADIVTYINHHTLSQLRQLGVEESKLVQLLPGVHHRFLQDIAEPAVAATTRHYNVAQPYILSVARLVERKGIADLIRAFSALDQTKWQNLHLVIVGDGPEKEHLQKVADEEFASTHVHFLSSVPDKHLPALFEGAELFALTPRTLPNDWEGFGIVYLEAAARGLPVVASNSGGISQAVIDGTTGILVPESDIAAITAALRELLTDSKKRANMKKYAVAHARACTWAATAQQFLTTLRKGGPA